MQMQLRGKKKKIQKLVQPVTRTKFAGHRAEAAAEAAEA
jgi:hypothetical protein